MPQVATQPCPHCGTPNPVGSTFCGRCGKALPTGDTAGPRIVSAGAQDTTTAGRQLLSDELRKKLNKSSGALLAVAILQAIMGPVMLSMAKSQAERQSPGQVFEIQPVAYVIVFGISAAFFGLWFWSRFQPYLAAIIGLVLFISIWLLDVVSDPTAIYKGIILRVIIIGVLVKAIQAGAEYRKLLDQQRHEQGNA